MARYGANGAGGACLLCPGSSDVNLFCYGKGIIDLDVEVPDGAFNLCVSEQEPHGTQIARCAGRSRLPWSVVASGY
jgi:hypothetical protein